MAITENIDVLVVGSGVAGLSAALYASRYGLTTIVIGDLLGGASSTAWTIENYPGFKSIDGYELMMKIKEQVEGLGTKVITDRVVHLEKQDQSYKIETLNGETIFAKAIILAVGAARRKLGLPKEDQFSQGKGVHYCTTCDGPLYKGKTIGIVGGGDSSIKGANLAIQYAEKIYIFVMGKNINAEPINFRRLEPFIQSGKVEVLYETQIAEILGESRLEGVKTKDGRDFKLDGLFVEIGAVPEVELAHKVGVNLDESGYVAVNSMMETNIPGIYAAGDTTNFFGHFKQIVTAAAMGSVASTSAFTFIHHSKNVFEAKAQHSDVQTDPQTPNVTH